MKYNNSYMVLHANITGRELVLLRLLNLAVDLRVYINGRMKLPDHDRSFGPELQYGGFVATGLARRLSPDSGVHDALPGSEVEWLVGNRVPGTQ